MASLFVENAFTTLKTNDNRVISAVKECLSFDVQGAHFARKATGRHRWNGKGSFYDARRAVFLSGFLPKVVRYLRSLGAQVEIYDKRVRPVTELGDFTLDGIELYDYQERAVREFFKPGRGVIQFPTGGGKTEAAAAIIKGLGFLPTLFLTHRVHLLYQTANRFAKRLPKVAKHIGVIGDGQFEPRLINLATVQTIDAHLKARPEIIVPYLEQVKVLFADEAHRSGARQFYLPSMLAANAFFRPYLTATPFMKGVAEDDMYLLGCAGPVCTRVTCRELIDRGIMARPFFRFFEVDRPADIRSLRKWRDIYAEGIVKNEFRNHLIAQNCQNLARLGKKQLVIVLEREHGQNLARLIEGKGLTVEYIDGDAGQYQREKALSKLSDGRLHAVVATNILDEGVDVRQLDAVTLAAGTKSAPAFYQRTGRAVRRKEKDNYALITDFIDKTHRKLLDHSAQRYAYAKNEDGFTIL